MVYSIYILQCCYFSPVRVGVQTKKITVNSRSRFPFCGIKGLLFFSWSFSVFSFWFQCFLYDFKFQYLIFRIIITTTYRVKRKRKRGKPPLEQSCNILPPNMNVKYCIFLSCIQIYDVLRYN